MSRHRGLHYARTQDEIHADEKRFADAWEEENRDTRGEPGLQKNLLEYLLSTDNHKVDVSDRDCAVAATVVQWLGSTIGEKFLHSLGYHRHLPRWRDENLNEDELRILSLIREGQCFFLRDFLTETKWLSGRIDRTLQKLRKKGRIRYDPGLGWTEKR